MLLVATSTWKMAMWLHGFSHIYWKMETGYLKVFQEVTSNKFFSLLTSTQFWKMLMNDELQYPTDFTLMCKL